MTPQNVLQQMLRAPYQVPDPGDEGYIDVDRDRLYCSLVAAGTETRTLRAPLRPGLTCHLGSMDAQTVTVTVLDSGGSTTGTIIFTAASQWIVLSSFELTDGVFSWQAMDVYGCTTTIQTAQNWSDTLDAGTMTTLVVSQVSAQSIVNTALTAASIVNTAITALTGVFKSINCSTGMTAPALTATGINATSVTAGTVAVSSNLTAANLTATGINATSVTAGTCNVSSNLQAASILATNLSVGTQATIPNILCSSNLSAASILATNLSVGTQATIPNILCSSNLSAASILATNLSVGTQATIPNILCSSNLSVASALATNISVGTGLTAAAIRAGAGGINVTAGNIIEGAQLGMTGGTADSSAQAITAQNALLAFTASTNNFYALPAPAIGLLVNVINRVGSTAALVANNATQSIQGATSFSIATSNAVGGAPSLFCDGTNWFCMAQ